MIGPALVHELRDWRSWYFLRRPVLWSLALFCCVLTALKATGVFDSHAPSTLAPFLGERVCVTGIVDDQPDLRPTGCVLSVQLEALTVLSSTGSTTQSLREQIMVHALGLKTAAAAPGDRIRACGSLRQPSSPQIPGVFDYADFLANRQIQAVLYTGGALHNWGDSGLFRLQRRGWALKQTAVRRFERALSPEQAAVMAGLVVGQRPRFHPELKEIFLRSGTMHVLVASGSNVAFVMLTWFLLLRCARVSNRWALTSSLLPVWMYTFISGGDAPIVRAAVMGSALVISHLLRRWDKPFNALGIAAWILLLINPRALFDLGFQMSFTTVLGLMLVMPWMETVCADVPTPLKWLVRVFTASLTAQIWLIPISVRSFHYMYIWSIFSNMIVVPLAGLGLPLGLAVIVCKQTGAIVGWYAQGLLWTVKTLATHLGARTWMAPLPFATVAGLYLCCFSIMKLREKKLARVGVAIGLLAIAIGCATAICVRPSTPSLSLTWIDTGRALATLVENRNDRLLWLPPSASQEQNIERTVLPFLATQQRRPVFALVVEDTAAARSPLSQELIGACSISTVTVCAGPIIWLESNGHRALLASTLTLRAQRLLLEKMPGPPDVMAARFPPHWKWDPQFLARFKPKLVIETGHPRKNAPSNSPWPDVPVVTPQTRGWYTWTPS